MIEGGMIKHVVIDMFTVELDGKRVPKKDFVEALKETFYSLGGQAICADCDEPYDLDE